MYKRQVVDFVSNELSRINVEFLKSPGHDIIKERLTLRGHKRLNFLSISFFTNRNQDIEGVLLMEYPNLCKDLRIIKNVGDIQ